jgi:hypothetical protein
MQPKRECGGCTVCCTSLPIQSDGLEKQAGVACQNLCEGGCAIYDKRPRACRAFLCGWRELSFIPEALRPDWCGVLIVADPNDIPPGYRNMPGVKFVITGGKEALAHAEFLECLAGLIEGRAPTFLAIPGPPGHFFAKMFLNERLAGAVRALDANAMTETLTAIAEELAKGPFDPVAFE